MTPEAQRKAIGEYLGWETYPSEKASHFGHLIAIGPDGKDAFMPDYLSDLNACAEMVKTLEGDEKMRDNYIVELCELVEESCGYPGDSTEGYFWMVNAPASMRCEAFLRTLDRENGGGE